MKHLMTAMFCCGLLLSAHSQTWNPDENFNNLIDMNDLLALLTVYGNEWTIDAGEGSEYDIAAYYAGEMNLLQCIKTCKSNNAAVMSVEEYALFQDSVDIAIGFNLPDNICDDPNDDNYYDYFYRNLFCRNNSAFGFGRIRRGGSYTCSYSELNNFSGNDNTEFYSVSGVSDSQTYHCVCSGLVPQID